MIEGIAAFAELILEFVFGIVSLFRKPRRAPRDPLPKLAATDRSLVAAARAKYRLSAEAATDLIAWARSQEPRRNDSASAV